MYNSQLVKLMIKLNIYEETNRLTGSFMLQITETCKHVCLRVVK